MRHGPKADLGGRVRKMGYKYVVSLIVELIPRDIPWKNNLGDTYPNQSEAEGRSSHITFG